MILVDFNNITSIYYSGVVKEVLEESKKLYKRSGLVEITDKDYKDIQKGFFKYTLRMIKEAEKRHFNYGDIVICADYDKKNYWRKVIHSEYKSNRDTNKKNEFDTSAWKNFNRDREALLKVLDILGIKVMAELETNFQDVVVSLEADETIGTLALLEPSVVMSNDRDHLQCTYYHGTKTINPSTLVQDSRTKKEILEYIEKSLVCGQEKDNIYNIKYCTKFDKPFVEFMLKEHKIEITDDMLPDFKEGKKYHFYTKEYKHQRDIESLKQIQAKKRKRYLRNEYFASPNFTELAFTKLKEKLSLEDILNENKLYRERFELNEKLFYYHMIPKEIEKCILDRWNSLEPKKNPILVNKFFNMFNFSYKERESFK